MVAKEEVMTAFRDTMCAVKAVTPEKAEQVDNLKVDGVDTIVTHTEIVHTPALNVRHELKVTFPQLPLLICMEAALQTANDAMGRE